jgi:hypothetical protein
MFGFDINNQENMSIFDFNNLYSFSEKIIVETTGDQKGNYIPFNNSPTAPIVSFNIDNYYCSVTAISENGFYYNTNAPQGETINFYVYSL